MNYKKLYFHKDLFGLELLLLIEEGLKDMEENEPKEENLVE